MNAYRTTILAIISALSGCAVGPDDSKPDIATPATYTQPTPEVTINVDHWVELYEDPILAELIESAGSNNHSLAALYQRTLQSRSLVERERSERHPQLSTQASYTKAQSSDEVFENGSTEELYRGALQLSWEIDLFGRVERLVESAEADARALEAAYADLLLITETDVAINYYRLRALEREIDAVERSVGTRRETLRIVNRRFESGAVSDLDVAQSETLLAESEAELQELSRRKDVRKNALAVLTGKIAPEFDLEATTIDGTPVDAPVGLPSDLLKRRPDLLQAEYALQAANARVGVATANFYPRITIGADAGYATTRASDWLQSSAGFYSFGPEIYLPIFQGGRLRAELSQSEYAYAESLELYKQQILEAFAEVEDALSGWRHLSTQRAARERAVNAANRAQRISETQYRNGLIDFIAALDSERVALDAERRLAQVIGDEYENSFRLIRSIGGSWE